MAFRFRPSPKCEFGPVFDSELSENVVDVLFYRTYGEAKLVGNLFIRLRFLDKQYYLFLPEGKLPGNLPFPAFRLLTRRARVFFPGGTETGAASSATPGCQNYREAGSFQSSHCLLTTLLNWNLSY